MKKFRSENGLLSLEASIVVTLFLFLMLFLYSFFIVFESRNEMAHVLLATADSLSLDNYEIDKLESTGKITDFLTSIYHDISDSDKGFISSERWTDTTIFDIDKSEWNGDIYFPSDQTLKEDEFGNSAVYSSVFGDEVKNRFFAYLSDGDSDEAEKILKRFHVKGGMDGLDFSGTHLSNGNLYIVLKYTLEYEYKIPGVSEMEFEQSVCSKLW